MRKSNMQRYIFEIPESKLAQQKQNWEDVGFGRSGASLQAGQSPACLSMAADLSLP